MARLILPVLALILLVTLGVMSGRSLPKPDVVIINQGDVTTLDLQRQSWMPDMRVGRMLFEGLVGNDVFSRGFDAVPKVAESWTVSDDGRTYTFRLRPDARWSDGEPVTAGDFVYAWRRAILPDTAAQYSSLFYHIEGAREFFERRRDALDEFESGRSDAPDAQTLWERTLVDFDESVGVRALDERTLEVTLVRAIPYFLDLCAMTPFYPVPAHVVRRYESPDPTTGWVISRRGWTKPPAIVSNGPFELVQWRFKRDMYLRRNPYYWDQDLLSVDTVKIPTIDDSNAQILAFQTGEVDWVSNVNAPYRGDIIEQKRAFYDEHRDEYERLKAQGLDPIEIDRRLPDDPRKHVHAFPAFGTYFYNFNCSDRLPDGRPNPFADARVRRAFAMAIDKQQIADQVRRLGEPVAATLIPPGSIGGYESPRGVPFDPEAARALLAEAGYPGGEGFITVEMLFNKDSGHDLIAQSIAKDWTKHLGVGVRLAQKELKVYRDELDNNRFITSRAGWYGDYGDPTTFLDINRTGDGQNDRRYSNPAYDELLKRAAMEPDADARLALLAEAERIIMDEDLPMVPIFHYANIYMFDPDRLSGITSHPRTNQNLFLLDVIGDGKGSETPLALPPTGGAQ